MKLFIKRLKIFNSFSKSEWFITLNWYNKLTIENIICSNIEAMKGGLIYANNYNQITISDGNLTL